MNPYTVYTRSRPVRIAFLVPSTSAVNVIDAIVQFNRKLWGGRWNPIIFVENDALAPTVWTFLKSYDADYILSPAPLNSELKSKLENTLCPICCAVFDENLYSADIPHNIAKVSIKIWREYFCQYSHFGFAGFVNIETQSDTPVEVTEFLSRNFGRLDEIIPWSSPSKRYHEGVQTTHIRFSVLENLVADLKNIPISGNFALPCQLSSIPVNTSEPNWFQEMDYFEIVVGDTPSDIAHVWNHTLRIRTSAIAEVKALWVSKQWFDSPAHLEGLVGFLKHRIHTMMRLGSHSLTLTGLQVLSAKLEHLGCRLEEPLVYDAQVFPSFRYMPSFWQVPETCEIHRCQQANESIEIKGPTLTELNSGSHAYISDVYISYSPKQFVNIIGKDFWWQFPRRPSLPQELQLFSHKWRVNAAGGCSVQLMGNNSRHGFWERTKLTLPTTHSFFSSLIHASCRPALAETGKFVNFLAVSDVGSRFMAVRGLFDNLSDTARVFDSRYWRRIFKQLSGRSKKGSEESSIRDFVTKHVKKREVQCTESDHIECLTKRLVHALQEFSNPTIALSYDEFVHAAREEMKDWNNFRPDNPFEFSEDRLHYVMNDFIERGLLLPGFQPRCTNCGFSSWISSDELSRHVKCTGCDKQFSIAVQEKWFYRLNNILRAKGYELEPLFLALNSLLRDSRDSFFYFPSAEFHLSYNQPWREVDLICITDGKLILGEVKSSYAEFARDDFRNMKEVARVVRPEEIIFTALYGRPTEGSKRLLEELAEELVDIGVSVRWYDLRISPDDPSPSFARPRGLD